MKMHDFLNYLKCGISFCVLYIIQFLIFPLLMPKYYPGSNNARFLFFVTAAAASILLIVFLTDKLSCLFAGDLIYGILICCFNKKGMYGIGRAGMNLDGMQSHMSLNLLIVTSILIVIFYFLIQCLFVLLKNKIRRL